MTQAQVREIAQDQAGGFEHPPVESAARSIAGTARSMGIEVVTDARPSAIRGTASV